MTKVFLFFVKVGSAIAGSILFTRCDVVLINNPQPLDAENVYEFPKKFRGSWVVDGDTISIGKDYYRVTDASDTLKIINGIYVNPADTMVFEKSDTAAYKKRNAINKHFLSLQTIKFDSLRNPTDTVSKFIIKGNLIYKIERDGLTAGTRFYIEHDTIYKIPGRVAFELTLGRNMFLRKISKDLYLVNVSATLFPEIEAGSGWWIVYLLEMKSNGEIYIRALDRSEMNDSEMIYSHDGTRYYDSRWTKQDVQRFVQNGLFEEGKPLGGKNRIRK